MGKDSYLKKEILLILIVNIILAFMNRAVFENLTSRKILVASLNWGQGHVYRIVPILQALIQQGNTIHIACDEGQKKVFEYYFPDKVEFHFIKGYLFQFSTKRSIVFSNFFQFPKLLKQHAKDHQICEKIVQKEKIDLVLSDHRYGWFSKKVPSVFLTHQCQLPIKNKWIQNIHLQLINTNFKTIWIYDDEQHSFAHDLSKTENILSEVHYLGAVSRFENFSAFEKDKIVAVISGPSPHNQNLLGKVKKYAEKQQIKVHCITNLSTDSDYLVPTSLEQQDIILAQAHTIISHIGYTTLMDIHYLQPSKYILIPSPNQLEQAYLMTIVKNNHSLDN